MATKHAKKRRARPARSSFRPSTHAFWSGTISFGLVSIPVQLYPANHNSGASLKLLGKDGTPLQRRYYSPTQDRDVHPEHIVRGYELEDGSYVIIRDEELESLEPQKSQVIELKQFVPRSQISPAYFERAYVLTPGGESTKAYHLLAAAMEDTDRIGIATFVMRDKEYLVAILAEDGVLRAQTLRFHDELRSPEEVGLPEKPELKRALVQKFEEAIHKNSSRELSASELQDGRAAQLHELAERKRKRGQDVVELPDQEPANQESGSEDGDGVGLLEAIRQSLRGREHGEPPHASRNGHNVAKQHRHSKSNGHAKRSRPRHISAAKRAGHAHSK